MSKSGPNPLPQPTAQMCFFVYTGIESAVRRIERTAQEIDVNVSDLTVYEFIFCNKQYQCDNCKEHRECGINVKFSCDCKEHW